MGGASQDGRSEPWPYVHSRSVVGWGRPDKGYPAVRTQTKNKEAPHASLSFMQTRDRARSLHGVPRLLLKAGIRGLSHSLRSENTESSIDPAKRGVCTHCTLHPVARRRAFTLFEARGINSNIMVYSECMHVDGRPALDNFLGKWRATWPRKRRRQRRQPRRRPRRKRSNRSTKPHSIRIASEVRCALRSTDRRQPSSQNIRATNSLTGPLCRWLLHKGPVFH